MRLFLHVTFKATDAPGFSPGNGDRELTAAVERPYGREPMVGEGIDIGLDENGYPGWEAATVEKVSWEHDGCHLYLGRVRATQDDTLEWLEGLGFKIP